MANRIIIVVWKWSLKWEKTDFGEQKGLAEFCDFIANDTADEKKYWFEMKVETLKDKFIGFTKSNQMFKPPDQAYTPEYNENNIKEKCEQLLKEGNKILLLLHKGEPDNFKEESKFHKNLMNKKNITIDFFWRGNGSIYDNLIKSNGTCFREDAINNPLDCQKIEIKKERFDNVWKDYFLKNLKKKLYELKEDLLIALYPLSFKGKDIQTTLQTNINGATLESRILNFNQNTTSTLEENYYSNFQDEKKELIYGVIKKCLINLLNLHKLEILEIRELKEIRYNFDQLLNSIEANIY